jgi:polygalacturonase
MKKNRITSLITAGILCVTLLAAPAALPSSQAHAEQKVYIIKYDSAVKNYFNRFTEAVNSGADVIKFEPGHTYRLDGMFRVPSNTTLDATGAEIVQEMAGGQMIGQPDDRRGKSSLRGYSAVHDITIKGGVWVGTKKYKPGATKKEGYRNGGDVINFIHSRNITLEDMTIYNCYNAHIIEFTGCKNCVIKNCNINIKPNGKPGFYRGSANNGAIQLDACFKKGSGNKNVKPFDGTVCQNIKILNNKIHYTTGIECAQQTSKKTKNVLVKGNTIAYHYKPYIHRFTKGFKAKHNKLKRY